MDLLDWFFSFSTAYNFGFSNEVTLTSAFDTKGTPGFELQYLHLTMALDGRRQTKSHNNQPKACRREEGGEGGELQLARGARGKRESIVWGRLVWVVYQNDIKSMCLLKKIISPPDHRVNKKPRTPPLDNLLQRGYLEGIG